MASTSVASTSVASTSVASTSVASTSVASTSVASTSIETSIETSSAEANVQAKATGKSKEFRKKANVQTKAKKCLKTTDTVYEDEHQSTETLIKFVRQEIAKECGSDPSRQLFHINIFSKTPKCWYRLLKETWNVPDLSCEYENASYSAYNTQRLQEGFTFKDFKAKYNKNTTAFATYNKWMLEQQWAKERKLNVPGADHGNKSQVCNWLFQACAVWGEKGFKYRMKKVE